MIDDLLRKTIKNQWFYKNPRDFISVLNLMTYNFSHVNRPLLGNTFGSNQLPHKSRISTKQPSERNILGLKLFVCLFVCLSPYLNSISPLPIHICTFIHIQLI